MLAIVVLLGLMTGSVGPIASLGVVMAQGTPVATPVSAGENWSDDAVCYEVFVRSFFDADGDGIGDLAGLTEKLDYINDGDPTGGQDLGATCVWLMPVMEAASYHGYDVVDYYTIESDYGTNADFTAFVAAAHERGIRVVLDLVLNHTSSQHPWFRAAVTDHGSAFRDWYIFEDENPGYLGPWGAPAWYPSPAGFGFYYGIFWEGMPDLDYTNPAVTAEAEKISAFWLNEMGVDGFRLDAIKHLIEDGRIQENTDATHAWLRDYRAFVDRTKPGVYTVGEIFDASPPTLEPYYPDQLHGYFNFEPGRQCLAAAVNGNAVAVGSALETAAETLPGQRWAPFLTNHDQARAMNALNGNVDRAKIAATCLLTMPGLPFVYYGEEIGMRGTKPDERIRTPMQWAPGAGGGFTDGAPWQPLQDDADTLTVAAQDADPASLLNHYRTLIHLHWTYPSLSHGDFLPLTTNERNVVAYLRRAEHETALVVLNFGNAAITGATLDGAASGLTEGAYALAPIFGEAEFGDLAAFTGGAVAGYALPVLAARTGYVALLEPVDV